MALGITPQEIIDKEEYQLLIKATHWHRIPLSEIAHVQNGFAFKSSLFDRDEGMSLIRIRDICKADTEHRYKGEYDSEYVVNTGDILIGMDGDFTAAKWQGSEALLNQRVCRLSLTSHCYNEKFFFLCLQPYLNAINAETSSITVKHLSSKTISDIPLPLPPLNEQKRIVAKIEQLFSELDNGIAALKTAREQLKVYRQAVLKHAFEGKLTAKWREENADKLEPPEQLLARIQQERDARYQQQLKEWKMAVKAWESLGKEGKRPAKPKKLAQLKNVVEADCVDYPMLPSGWSYVRLGMLMDEPTYGTSAKCEYESGEQGVLRIPNIINGTINDADLKFATFEKGEVDHLRLEEGDILTIRSNGSISLVGSCALITEKDTQHIFAGYLIRLRSNPNLVLPSFLLSVMSSHLLRKQIEIASKSTSGVNNINSGELQNLIIPLPTLDEQRELLIHLDALTPSVCTIEEELVNQLKKTETLRQSILKKAFSGKLVPQDPSDEPASELLARIKAEKEQQKQPVKKSVTKRRRKKVSKETLN